MSDDLSSDVVSSGVLKSGRGWQLVSCVNPDSCLRAGRHLILECVGRLMWAELEEQDLDELRLLAFRIADSFAQKPGRYRIDFNGPKVATIPSFHCHIKLPFGDDKLRRLVGDG